MDLELERSWIVRGRCRVGRFAQNAGVTGPTSRHGTSRRGVALLPTLVQTPPQAPATTSLVDRKGTSSEIPRTRFSIPGIKARLSHSSAASVCSITDLFLVLLRQRISNRPSWAFFTQHYDHPHVERHNNVLSLIVSAQSVSDHRPRRAPPSREPH